VEIRDGFNLDSKREFYLYLVGRYSFPSDIISRLDKFMFPSEVPTKGLSFVVDESIKRLQSFLEDTTLTPNEAVQVGDVVADLYDYNQAYKAQQSQQEK
jgi:hypothetical protein